MILMAVKVGSLRRELLSTNADYTVRHKDTPNFLS